MDERIIYFFPKVLNQIRARKTPLFEHLPVERMSTSGLGGIPDKTEFIRMLSKILIDSDTNLVSLVSENDKDSILRRADESLTRSFLILGVKKEFTEGINWCQDFRTGDVWPDNVFYKKQWAYTSKGSDIKFPWELSRCHHLLWLGEAYLLTDEEKYAEEITKELYDWIDKNPLMYTVNWTCAMEVAIRAVNWMYALLFIKDSKHLTDELVGKVYKSLYQHGFFITNNLERTIPYANNHYYSDVIGLLYIGQLFKHTRRGKKWYKFALTQYYQETLIQNLPSGVNYEKSVSYHRLMTELALFPYYMLVRAGEQVPNAVVERLTKMVDYIRLNSMQNGNAPMIADNDDGRFLPFVPRDFRKHRYLTDCHSTEMRIIAYNTEMLPVRGSSQVSSLIQDAKIAILRRGESYLFITNADRWRCDKNKGNYVGSHMHSDLLSFVYSVGNSEIFVDSGSYVYTSDLDKHQEFRSTAKHNTIVVDGEEQHLREMPSAFMMKYNATSKPLSLSQKNDCDECSGEYTTLQGGMTHLRTFILGKGQLQICDRLKKGGNNHRAVMYFHLAPEIVPRLVEGEVLIEVDGKKLKMSFYHEGDYKISIVQDTFSPSYGVLLNSNTVVIEFCFNEVSKFDTNLKMYNNGKETV